VVKKLYPWFAVLVRPVFGDYDPFMFARIAVLSVLLLIAGTTARSEVVLLKDKAAVTGKILAEKRDLVLVDLGYTVLSIPRSQIVRITSEDVLENKPAKGIKGKATPAAQPALLAQPEDDSVLYRTTKGVAAEKSVREQVAQLGESVVQVRTPGGLGSGFFLNEEGYLITNFHVIEGETQISIEVFHHKDGQWERKVYKQVRIVAMNKFHDLALLKVEDKDAPKFSWVPLGDSDALAVGERVFAIGSPLGLERTVTEGIVSTKTRLFQGELYIQTTAQINPGNSGGPLFNLKGEVTGVTNMKVFGEGLGFAIPVENVKRFLKHRDAFAYDTDNPSNPYRYLQPPSRLRQGAQSEAASSGDSGKAGK
jgi:serine protease Do